jgi:hypothetical protein
MREADDTPHDGVGDFNRYGQRARLRRHPSEIPVRKASRRGIVWMDQQRAPRPPFYQAMRVVHPRVVAAKLSSSDQEKVRARAVRIRQELIARFANEVCWRDVDLAVSGSNRSCDSSGLERPEVDAVGRLPQL